jgi:FMN-dependent NADH-azoreductase
VDKQESFSENIENLNFYLIAMKKLLFVNACVNRGTSRTYRLSKALISLLEKTHDFDISELALEEENIQALTSNTLNKRFELLKNKDLSNEMFKYANQFKEADCIVIAAPYWDFGFPAMLKNYIEAVSVTGIVYKFGEDGAAGLCKAEKIYYVTTRGGYTSDEKDLGFATVAELSKFYGIKKIKCISANGFGIPSNDHEATLKNAIEALAI